MKNRITTETAETYRVLAEKAKAIQEQLDELQLEIMKAEIPEKAKFAALDWVRRTETFRGMSYFLTPQTEWMGGESFVTMNPHIAR